MSADQSMTTQKIKRISKFFRIIFQIAFIVQPVLLIIYWLHAPLRHFIPLPQVDFSLGFSPTTAYILHPLHFNTRIYAFLLSLIPLSISELMFYYLVQLFKLYENADIFNLPSVNYIKYVGYALLTGQIIDPFYQAALSAILTWHNPHGERYAEIHFAGGNLATILVAFLIILISWIMAEGYKLQEEQKYII